jgi:hypothetical protein
MVRIGVGIGRKVGIDITIARRMVEERGVGISMNQGSDINIDTMMERERSIVIALKRGNDIIDDIGREMGVVIVAIDETFQAR